MRVSCLKCVLHPLAYLLALLCASWEIALYKYIVYHVGTSKLDHFFPFVFINFIDKSCKYILYGGEKNIFKSSLYKRVSSHEMSPQVS